MSKLEEKMITEAQSKDIRRKYYRLTDKGQSVFKSELQRYQQAVELANQRKLLTTIPALDFAYA